MYGREYDGQTLGFEASGGLVSSSLVMRDQQTNSYWSLMKGAATAGPLAGTQLEEIGSRKTRWSDWRARHPETRVLSVRGREYVPDRYAAYWRSPAGFRGQRAKDRRLATKAPIFAFRRDDRRFAVAHESIELGHVAVLPDGTRVFLHRPKDSPIFQSTAAFVSRAGFARDGSRWIELESGAAFDPKEQRFEGGAVRRQKGFDTFWYNWSLNHPDTDLLE